MFIPLFIKLGPAKFRRFLLEIAPSQDLQKIKEVVDVMADTSIDIFRQKVDALRQGDEAVAQQVGEGKDVMSILRKSLSNRSFLASAKGSLALWVQQQSKPTSWRQSRIDYRMTS